MSSGGQSSKQALAWLGIGAISASCGGRAAELRKSDTDGASGSMSSMPPGVAGRAGAGAGTIGAGGAQNSGAGGGAETTRGGGTSFGGGGLAGQAGTAGGTGYGGMTAAGGNGAGRGNAGDAPTEPGGAAGAEPVVEGAVMLDVFSQDVDPSRACKTGKGLTYRIGDTLNGHLVTNGTDGVMLSCKVVNNSNGTFELTGSISGTATAKSDAISYAGGTADPLEVPLAFIFASQGSSDVQQSYMTISYVSSDVGELEVPDTALPCTLTTTARYQGFLLGNFDCPLLASPDDDTSACRIEGVLDFLHCDTSE